MNDIKAELNKISIDPKLKNDIYNSILEQAKNEEFKPEIKIIKKNKFQKIVVAMVAVLAIGFFGLYGTQNLNQTPEIAVMNNQTEQAVRGIVEEVESLDIYYVSKNQILKTSVDNCPVEPQLAWEKIKKCIINFDAIELLNYEYIENDLILTFDFSVIETKEEKKLTIDALQKTYSGLLPQVKNVIIK